MTLRCVVVIPARYDSTRLPGKPLADIGGKPMIQHVYERASLARVDRVVVATDDQRIAEVVRGFGGEVMMTSPSHFSGTDRVAEVARTLDARVVVNVQGDEPLLPHQMVDAVVMPLVADPSLPMCTLAHPLEDPSEVLNPDVVKVVCDRDGNALYFSRSPIPYPRGRFGHALPTDATGLDPILVRGFLKHVGIYAYQSSFLQTFASLPPTFLESLEKLEQLRALEHGFRIRVIQTFLTSIGVDTEEDLARVRALIQGMGEEEEF